MKKMKLLSLIVLTFVISTTANAQYGGGTAAPMVALNSGDISSLDKVTTLNFVYDYTDMGVGAYRKEQDYVDKHCKELEEKDKKGGACERFKEGWKNARAKHYEPKFEIMFNKYGKGAQMSGTNSPSSAEHTLLIKTTFIEPGYNIGISKKPAFVDLECIFKDKAGTELCKFYVKNAVGSNATGYDFAVESRVVEGYAKAAKMLTAAIVKERKKAAKKKK